jgi:hypothetical protein
MFGMRIDRRRLLWTLGAGLASRRAGAQGTIKGFDRMEGGCTRIYINYNIVI